MNPHDLYWLLQMRDPEAKPPAPVQGVTLAGALPSNKRGYSYEFM